jgi:hypothetical protein
MNNYDLHGNSSVLARCCRANKAGKSFCNEVYTDCRVTLRFAAKLSAALPRIAGGCVINYYSGLTRRR